MQSSTRKTFEYFRISVTDRCNLRCVYCMPAEGVPNLPHSKVISYEEIIAISKVAIDQGVFKIRITGGEPLVRKGISGLIGKLSQISGIRDLSMTTNGILLESFAKPLRDAGLQRINISLDSLLPERFSQISRGGDLKKVLEGIEKAIEIGFSPIKMNVVLIHGFNEDEVLSFCSLAFEKPIQIRFIERMPFQDSKDQNDFISQKQIQKVIETRFPLEPHPGEAGGGPAEVFSLKGGKGQIGFISPRTQPFCSRCNRLRLSSDGTLFPCLDSSLGTNVRGLSENQIRDVFIDLATKKNKESKSCASFQKTFSSLSKIGG